VNSIKRSRLARYLRQLFGGLPRRAMLTIRYQGWRTFLVRILTFPLRLTPLGRRFGLGPRASSRRGQARTWYRREGRPVTIVIPTYGAPDTLLETVASIRRTTDPRRVRIVVVDDGSPEEHRRRLAAELTGAELVLCDENRGFAATANEGIRRAADGDVVLMNNDVIARDDWLEVLAFGAYGDDRVGIAGPKLLYEDGTIQSAGTYRNLAAPEWFDHRYRFRPADYGPANAAWPALAMTGACLYVKREALDRVGLLDEGYRMAFEDVDWCLRTWQAGMSVLYYPYSELTHLESKTRGTAQGERELDSQRRFWERWGAFFGERPVRAEDGGLRIIYVTEDTGVGGGHRDVFEHLNHLAARGHHAELYSLDGPPDWFPLEVPVRRFEDYEELEAELAGQDAIKIATWWATAAPVWRASVLRGVPVFFVQDIETSYYPDAPDVRNAVLASYREEFRFVTISQWNRERLAELGVDAHILAPGIDLENFRQLDGARRDGVILALGRSNPLKNLPLTVAAWKALPEPRPELWLFGIEPELGKRYGTRYITAPSDAEVNELYNTATAFVQTSTHEGFCLPPLEAMASGTPVVCTDAHGNRDFCRDGENCLVPEAEVAAVRDALARVLTDPELRARLGEEGRRTAAEYDWSRRIDEVERFYEGLAG
jgi:GT2 family glycosyltransferase/glycosyltransferase involved in cell wall biosynthesis